MQSDSRNNLLSYRMKNDINVTGPGTHLGSPIVYGYLHVYLKLPYMLQIEGFSLPVFHSRVDPSSPVLLDEPVLHSMAKKYNQTPALIALRYQLQRGIVALSSTLKVKRVKENIQVLSQTVSFKIRHTDSSQCTSLATLDSISPQFFYLASPCPCVLNIFEGFILTCNNTTVFVAIQNQNQVQDKFLFSTLKWQCTY